MPVKDSSMLGLSAPIEVNATASVDEVLTAFQSLRAEILQLLGEVGADPSKTRELGRALDLNRGIAWRLSRIARSVDGSDIAHDVPSSSSIEKFTAACASKGGAEGTIARVLRASQNFERKVESCSGGRKTLGMLLANHQQSRTGNDRERARRALFEGACAVWGVQAATRFVSVFLYPSQTDHTRLSAAHVTGYVGFRRLSARPWPMSYEAVHDERGVAQPIKKEPLDPTGYQEGELQLLRNFCSPSDPGIEVRNQGTYKVFDLASGPVGNEGLTNCVFGSFLNDIYERRPESDNTAGFMVMLQTPVENVLFDLFVHKDVEHTGDTITHLLDRLTYPHENREEDFDDQCMPLHEQAVDLPRGIHAAATPHIPWYTDLLRFVESRMRMPVDDFACSRFEMAYPPISTTLSRRITTPGPA